MSFVVIIVYVKVLGLTGFDLALSKKLITKYSWNSESTASPDSWLEWFLNTYILGFFQLRLNSKKKKLIGGFLSYKYSILGTSEGTACGVDHQYAGLEIVRATSTGITITSTPQCSRPWFCYLNSWELRDHFHGASVLSKIKHRWIISFPFIFWQDMGNRLAGPIYLATSISLSVCFQVAVPCTRPPEGKKKQYPVNPRARCRWSRMKFINGSILGLHRYMAYQHCCDSNFRYLVIRWISSDTMWNPPPRSTLGLVL